MRSVDIERADIYCDGCLAGLLERTSQGCRFTYHPDFRQSIAYRMPRREEPYDYVGDNLPPFFANLLPEGMRLNALIARSRTSASDMFTLLLEAGPECIGDIYAAPHGVDPHPGAQLSIRTLNKADFSETLARALEGAPDGAIPGVQEKLSISDATIALPLREETVGSAILKLSPAAFPNLVENEAFFLHVAKKCGIQVPEARIVTDRKGQTGLLVKRFDRIKPEKKLHRVHQEDGCQLADRYPADKYRIPLRQVVQDMSGYVSAPIPEILELLKRYAFSYIIGNADLHAKNISVLVSPQTGLVVQTPMYDVVSTLAYSSLDTRMAIQMDGKDDKFKTTQFVEFGTRFGIPKSVTFRMLALLCIRLEPHIHSVRALPFEPKTIERMRKRMYSRLAAIRPGKT